MIESIHEWIANKVTLSLIAVGVGNLAANAPQKYIDLAATGIGPLSYTGWIAAISCFWIITLLLEKWGFFHLAKWIWEKIRARKN